MEGGKRGGGRDESEKTWKSLGVLAKLVCKTTAATPTWVSQPASPNLVSEDCVVVAGGCDPRNVFALACVALT